MTKRVGLTSAVAAGAAARGEAKKSEVKRRGAPAASTPSERSASTAITISPEDWKLLRAVAFSRAQEGGGRASVSALIGELIDQARAKLKTEAGRFYGE
jgi:hypothetical protein